MPAIVIDPTEAVLSQQLNQMSHILFVFHDGRLGISNSSRSFSSRSATDSL